nr:hypothetical protein [Tanacetum cinerariifolium]
ALRSPEYVPDPIKLEYHVPAYIPENPEDLLLAEDEAPIEAYVLEVAYAPTPPLPPSFLSPRIRPPHTRAAIDQMRAAVPSTYPLLLLSGTPPLLPIPLPPGPTMARSVDCSFVETMETRFRDTERRMMTTLEMVNMRDRAAVRAEIEVLRRERLAYEQESIQTRKALARFEAYSRALEARVAVLETQARRHEWQCQTVNDLAKMAPKRTTRSTQVPPVTPAPTATTTIVTEAQLQALIDQGVTAIMAEAKASRVRNGYDSNGSEPRLAQAVRVALTWWNSHVKTVTLEVSQALPWKTLKKMMTDKYCPRGEIKKLKTEMWKLKTKGTDVIGSKPQCSKCDYHHKVPCPPRCHNCNRVVHLTRDCRSRPANANNNRNNNNNNQKGNGYYECGAQGHFKRNCPKLKNNNRGNQGGNDNAQARVYVVGNARANPDNVVAGMFLLNNCYAYILFDMGTDRSFVSTTFSSKIDIAPIALDHHYNVE